MFIKTIFIFALTVLIFSCEQTSTSDDGNISRDTNVTVKDFNNKPLEQTITSIEEDTVIGDSLGEYTYYHIDLSIETSQGVYEGYAFVSTFDLNRDSLHNSAYLKNALRGDFGNGDSLIYFNNRIRYEIGMCYEDAIIDQKEKLYYLLNRIAIPLNKINKIKIKNIFVESSLEGIANTLTLKDTSWMNKKPIRCIGFGGYLCSFNLYIYEESKLTSDIIKRANAIMLKYKDDEDEIDKKLGEEIRKLDGQKVIVIQGCTC